ncbi:uncharacterized protein LOC128394795 [Panonychus citri]|uniref:uncharacterized protein LOC128394795 n=1 Tax=Panonychus citri TaxID=50023 RepID=UPI00230750BB|nr:uncharacterized protein LOC128394795 [Panonychus citri]
MSSGFFRVINRWKVPVVISFTSAYVAVDTYRMKMRKESEICVNLNGKPVIGVLGDVPCVSPKLQEIIDDVKSTLNLPQSKKSVLNYYVTPYPKPIINGYYSSYSTIDVFLPDYLNISSGEQLTALAICNIIGLMGENFESLAADDWLTPDGKSFINSFLLSERAKKYLVTQTSYSNLNPEYHLKYIVFSLVSAVFLVCMAMVDERAKGGIAKIGLLLLLAIPMGLLKNLLSGHSRLLCESNGVAQAISRNMLTWREMIKTQDESLIDEEMLLGALEYYSKLLQRNKASYRLFSSGFRISRILNDDGEDVNPFNLELPRAELIRQLQRIQTLLNSKKSLDSSSNVDSQ